MTQLFAQINQLAPHASAGVIALMVMSISLLVFGVSVLVVLTFINPAKFKRVLVRGMSWCPVQIFFIGGILLGRVWMTVGCTLLCMRAFYELMAIQPARYHKVLHGLGYLSLAAFGLLLFAASWSVALMALVGFICLALPVAIWRVHRRTFGHHLLKMSWMMGLSGISLGALALICWLPLVEINWAAALLFLVAIPQFSDLFQYLGGKLFGQTPFAPTISPSKTWEGAITGAVVGTLIGIVFGPLMTPWGAFGGGVVALVLCIGGLLGDLLLSQIKRDAGVKDFELLLPEFGGALDRVDSLVINAPLYGLAMVLMQTTLVFSV